MNRFTVVLCGLLLAALPSTSALADTVYTYTGNPFTSVIAPFSSSDSVSGSFTLSSPLEANLTILGPGSSITPTSFSFTDGVDTLSDTTANLTVADFEVGTDAAGAITSWNIRIQTSNVIVIQSEDWNIFNDQGSDGHPGENGFTRNPGTWTSSTTDPNPAPTPEPNTLALLGSGVVGLAGMMRRRFLA